MGRFGVRTVGSLSITIEATESREFFDELTHGKLIDRGHDVMTKLKDARIVPWHFNVTQAGQPVHPLYLPKNAGIRPLAF